MSTKAEEHIKQIVEDELARGANPDELATIGYPVSPDAIGSIATTGSFSTEENESVEDDNRGVESKYDPLPRKQAALRALHLMDNAYKARINSENMGKEIYKMTQAGTVSNQEGRRISAAKQRSEQNNSALRIEAKYEVALSEGLEASLEKDPNTNSLTVILADEDKSEALQDAWTRFNFSFSDARPENRINRADRIKQLEAEIG